MLKQYLINQLRIHLRNQVTRFNSITANAAYEAKTGSNRAVNLARGSVARLNLVQEDLEVIEAFQVKDVQRGQRIEIGSIVEIEDGEVGKTLLIAPVGAGVELNGPGGDGIFYVVTPHSPLGKALLGRKMGDSFDFEIGDHYVEWNVVFAE